MSDDKKVIFSMNKVSKTYQNTNKQVLKDISKPGLKIGERIKYLTAPPGWSHDGATQTANELRKELCKNETCCKNVSQWPTRRV